MICPVVRICQQGTLALDAGDKLADVFAANRPSVALLNVIRRKGIQVAME